MNKNIKVAKELVKIAKSLVANTMKMKFIDFIKQEADIDTSYGIIDWEIAFCGPCQLTEQGKKKFAPLFDKEIQVNFSGPYAYAHAVDLTESEAKLFRQFLKASAGYCSESEYDKWFTEYQYNKQELIDRMVNHYGGSGRNISALVYHAIKDKLVDEDDVFNIINGMGSDEEFYKEVNEAVKADLDYLFDQSKHNAWSIITLQQLSPKDKEQIEQQVRKKIISNIGIMQDEIEKSLSRIFHW